jgi:chromosome segregation ATPase
MLYHRCFLGGSDKLRRDVLEAKEETHAAIQEGMGFKQTASRLEVELQGSKDQERMLNDQIEQQDAILSQLQTELKAERTRCQEATEQQRASRRQINELQEQLNTMQDQQRENSHK